MTNVKNRTLNGWRYAPSGYCLSHIYLRAHFAERIGLSLSLQIWGDFVSLSEWADICPGMVSPGGPGACDGQLLSM